MSSPFVTFQSLIIISCTPLRKGGPRRGLNNVRHWLGGVGGARRLPNSVTIWGDDQSEASRNARRLALHKPDLIRSDNDTIGGATTKIQCNNQTLNIGIPSDNDTIGGATTKIKSNNKPNFGIRSDNDTIR